MLSNPLHRFSAYNALPSNNMMGTGHVPSNHMHSGLDTLAHGSQYALQQLQHVEMHQNPQVHRSHNSKHRQHPYTATGSMGGSGRNASASSASGPIRRRISRACDQCNQLRTKCDGQSPCAHCVGKFSPESCWAKLIERRIRVGLRIYQRAKEARKGFAKGPRTTSCSGCCQWTEITYESIFRRKITDGIAER
jgi:hypothetical protein